MSDTKPQFDELRREGRRVYDSRGRLIARCSEQHPPREKTPPYWVQEAYAQLFKAAPKLLAACEAYYYGRVETSEAERMMAIAIAEAKGQ